VDAEGKLAHLSTGGAVAYDALLIACGALPKPAVPGALTFRGPADVDLIRRLLDDVAAGQVQHVAFVLPWGAVWSLPIYELALMTASWAAARGMSDVDVAVVTPEDEPLHLFGRQASDAVRELLEKRGVALHVHAGAVEAAHGQLRLLADEAIPADRVVALARLAGPRIDGIPQTRDGFVPTDASCRVTGVSDVYAAGDITTFPVKQGGIAAQQADAAAEAIAAEAGADIQPHPFRPVLRGMLLTGAEPRYLRGIVREP
jgi:sulfide:quinone oxidoreductase